MSTKRSLIVGLLLVVVMLFAALPTKQAAADAGGVGSAMQAAGDRLISLQNNDGGWDWPLDDGNPASVSPLNTLGPIGKGLGEAYRLTGDADFLTALQNAGALLLTKQNTFSPSDGYLAAQLDEIFGGSTYKDHVNTYFYGPLAAGTYFRLTEPTVFYDTAAYVNRIRTNRSGSQANLAAWDIGMGLIGAASCGADTTAWVAGVKAEIEELAVGYYDVVGLAGALYGLAYVDIEFDPLAGMHESAGSLADLADILVSYQINNGGFTWESDYVIADDFNESIQETAYAILALNEVNRTSYLSNIQGAADYMLSVQLANGGWYGDEYYDEENNEITAEAAWGISVAYPELQVCADQPFTTIQSAIDAASDGDTILVCPGTYPEEVYIYKSLTLLGPNAGIDPNTGTRVAEAIVVPAASDSWYSVYTDVGNVVIDGFTIDGQSFVDYGIYAQNTNITGPISVQFNKLINYVEYSFIGWNSSSVSSGNLIMNNLFDNCAGRSIVPLWNYYADVKNNVITNTSVGIYSENTSLPSSIATVVWDNNTIEATRSGIWYNLAYGTATPPQITNNKITAVDSLIGIRFDGIWLTSLGGSVNPLIKDNTIVGSDITQLVSGYHLWNDGTTATGGITVEGGSVTDADYGFWANNWDGYPTSTGSNAGPTTATIKGVTIDGSRIAGVYVKDNPLEPDGDDVTVTLLNNVIKDSITSILVEGDDAMASGDHNKIYSITTDVQSTVPTTLDFEYNFWGSGCGPANVIGDVDYTPWYIDDTMTTTTDVPPVSGPFTFPIAMGTPEKNAIIACAAPGSVFTFETGLHAGGLEVGSDKYDLTFELNGATVGIGSSAFLVFGDDITINGPGVLDGTGGSELLDPDERTHPGVAIFGDNFNPDGVELKNWYGAAVVVVVPVESVKIVNNWFHDNNGGLQVQAVPTGVVTIKGNLFKQNGMGVDYIGGPELLDATYNSWGDIAGPGGQAGEFVDAEPFNYYEIYFDMDPTVTGEQTERQVFLGDTFTVDLNADAENVYGLTFKYTYDHEKLVLVSTTFDDVWEDKCTQIGTPPTGTVEYFCNLTNGDLEWQGGTIATFEFTAIGSVVESFFDIFTEVPITTEPLTPTAGAVGGVKVWVNNAGYNDPSIPARDITDGNDGVLNLVGGNFTGFIDLQGRPNDSGALFEVYDELIGGTLLTSATSASSGKYTTAHIPGLWMVTSVTDPTPVNYYVFVDRALFLPTNGRFEVNLTDTPLTTLNQLLLKGGDATNDNEIGSTDAGCIGGAYGTAGGLCGTDPLTSSDVNGDGRVDIYDLTLMGGNYNVKYSLWTPQ